MSTDDLTNAATRQLVRFWFDALCDLPATEVAVKLAALDVPEHVRKTLRQLLEIDAANRETSTATAYHEPPAQLREDSTRALGEPIFETADLATDAAASPWASLIGTTVGSFRLVELLGRGGSSVVFRAERQVGDGTQTVALKMLASGLFSLDAQRRFRREQAILAGLTHPNIARLIEGGIGPLGVPYIALEYVDGEPITTAADARGLGLDARLHWFVGLCRVVDAAHRALVLHCDLKPGNLLIARDGSLKVLDFGIARLLDSDAESYQTRAIALTPEYAAPEQFQSQRLTTAVDVYALGVVLGELVSGQRLQGTQRPSDSVRAMQTAVPAGLPPAAALARALTGELDAIVLMSIESDPALRYGGAGALADDVERYLGGIPVRAYASTRLHRLRKFLQRNARSVLLATGIVVAIAAGTAFSLYQSVQALRAETRALAEANRANSMRDFLFDAFSEAEPSKPKSEALSVATLVDRAIASATQDQTLDVAARTELLIRLAEVVGSGGDLDRSRALLLQVRKRAQDELGDTHPLTWEVDRLLAHDLSLRGDYARSLAELRSLLDRVPQVHEELRCRILRESAQANARLNRVADALDDAQRAVDIALRLENVSLRYETTKTLAGALLAANRDAAAAQAYTQTLAIAREKYGENSDQAAAALAGLSRASRKIDQLDAAERYARAAIEIDRAIYPGDHWITGNHYNALGQALLAKSDLQGAHAALQEGARISGSTLGEAHPETLKTVQSLVYVDIAMEDYAEAARRSAFVLDKQTLRLGENSIDAAMARSDFGYATAQDDRDRGIHELDAAISVLERSGNGAAPYLALALWRRIRLALDQRDLAKVDSLSVPLFRAIVRLSANRTYWLRRSLCLQGELLLLQDRAAQAGTPLALCKSDTPGRSFIERELAVEQQLLDAKRLEAIRSAAAAAAADEARRAMRDLPHIQARFLRLADSLPR